MKTRQQIVQELIEETSHNIPSIKNYRIGGVFRLFIEVVASFMETFYMEMEQNSSNLFLMTSKGKWLDLKAEELSLKRYPATKTRGYVTFSRLNNSDKLSIPKNTIVSTEKGLRYMVIDEDYLEVDESIKSILVEAEIVGVNYNVVGNSIVKLITPIKGVDSINNSQDWIHQYGKDEESDDSLRIRCLELWKDDNYVNKEAYIKWAKKVKEVDNVVILTESRGEGTVDIIFTETNNSQPTQELVNKVQIVVDEKKSISTNVKVRSPLEVFINLSISVEMYPDVELDRNKLFEAIHLYFKGLKIGSDFESSALVGHIFAVDGVKSVVVDMPESRQISILQIARCGEISLELSNSSEF